MESYSHDDTRQEAAVWQAMVLFSTLSTASEVWQATRERRAGRDPSAQEETAFVRSYLRAASGELQALLMQLRASLAYGEGTEEAHLVTFVRRYHDLATLRRATNLLHVIHQRLLSLYPAVSEDLVEAARVIYREAGGLMEVDNDHFSGELERFLGYGLRFTARLHEEVPYH